MLLAEKMAVTEAVYITTVGDAKIKPQKSRNLLMILIGSCLALLIVFNLIIQALVIQQSRRIKDWRSLINGKERQVVKIRMEIADLGSFNRIQSMARNELGMRDAGPGDFHLIKAAPNLNRPAPSTSGYLAQSENRTGLWSRLTAWVGGFGRTLARNL